MLVPEARAGVHPERARDVELPPALDPHAAYLSRLSARSALYTDLRILLKGLETALPSAGYRALIAQENRLARPSMAARWKLWKELKIRYILDAKSPVFAAFWGEWRRCQTDAEHGLTAYVLLALTDRLVADLGTEWLFPLLRRAPSDLRVPDVLHFIERSAPQHPEVIEWSVQTRLAVAQKYLASLRDFGLASGVVKKTSVRPALYGAPVRLLIRAQRLARIKDADVLQAPLFRLLALDGVEVIDALGDLNRRHELRFRMQGDVVELSLE